MSPKERGQQVRLDALVQDTSLEQISGLALTWQKFGQCKESRIIGHKTGGEEQGWVLPVQFSQLLFKFYVELAGTWDIASTTSSSSMILQGLPDPEETEDKEKQKQKQTLLGTERIWNPSLMWSVLT